MDEQIYREELIQLIWSNPSRVKREQFDQRLHSKQILHKWPLVQVNYDE